ncbi:MAG: phage major capsid protein, partial [Tepidisphaeraceae bacterium]
MSETLTLKCDAKLAAPSAAAAAGSAPSASPASRRFEMIGYTGGMLNVSGWNVPVVIDLTGLDVGSSSRPILVDHDASLDSIIGQTKTITKNAGKLQVTGNVYPNSPRAQRIADLNDAGFKFQASVGAVVGRRESVPAGSSVKVNGQTFTGPLVVARTSSLKEISFVALGADDQTSAQILSSRKPMNGNEATPIDQTTTSTPAGTAAVIQAARLPDGEAEEMARIDAIAAAHEQFGGKYPDIMATALKENWSPSRFKIKLYEVGSPRINAYGRNDPAEAKATRRPGAADHVEAAMLLASGLNEKFVAKEYGEQTVDAVSSSKFANSGIHAAMRFVLRQAGESGDFGRVTPDVIRATFHAGNVIQADGFSSISLPGILSNVANKFVMSGYLGVKTTWPQFCGIRELKDFKPATLYRMTGLGKFQKVGPDGELKHITLGEEAFPLQADTDGAMIALTRQMIMNDDLGMLQGLAQPLGRMAAISVERNVFTLLLSNPSNFFSEANGNLLDGADSALGIDGLTAGETAFLNQVDKNGDPTLVQPQFVLVPTALSTTAASLLRSVELRDTGSNKKYGTTNPHAGRFDYGVS